MQLTDLENAAKLKELLEQQQARLVFLLNPRHKVKLSVGYGGSEFEMFTKPTSQKNADIGGLNDDSKNKLHRILLNEVNTRIEFYTAELLKLGIEVKNNRFKAA